MKQLKWIIPALLTIAIVGYLIMKPKLDAKNLDFTYIPLEKGHIEAVVSSTGTLEAINTVEIGTQISGTIKKIYVDYNDEVTAGQLLAEMDLNLLQTNLISAQANLAVAQAQLNQVRDTYNRNQALYKKSVISEQEYKDSQYDYGVLKRGKPLRPHLPPQKCSSLPKIYQKCKSWQMWMKVI